MTYFYCFLAFDVGVLAGMGLTAWFIGAKGCYEDCMLQAKDDE